MRECYGFGKWAKSDTPAHTAESQKGGGREKVMGFRTRDDACRRPGREVKKNENGFNEYRNAANRALLSGVPAHLIPRHIPHCPGHRPFLTRPKVQPFCRPGPSPTFPFFCISFPISLSALPFPQMWVALKIILPNLN